MVSRGKKKALICVTVVSLLVVLQLIAIDPSSGFRNSYPTDFDQAIRAMGANAIPYLGWSLAPREYPFQEVLDRIATRTRRWRSSQMKNAIRSTFARLRNELSLFHPYPFDADALNRTAFLHVRCAFGFHRTNCAQHFIAFNQVAETRVFAIQ